MELKNVESRIPLSNLKLGSSNYQSCGLRAVTCKVKPEGKMQEMSGAGMVGPWRGLPGAWSSV